MTVSLTINQPLDNTLINTSDTTIIVNVTDPGSDPTRQLNIEVNSLIILTVIGGLVTYLDPGYSVAILVNQYTLTKLTSWIDPQNINITAYYQPTGISPVINTSATIICAKFKLVTSDPYDEQSDVQPNTPVNFTVSSSAFFYNGQILIDDQLAYDLYDGIWNSPNFTGQITTNIHLLTAHIQPRRFFNSEEAANILLIFGLVVDPTISNPLIVTIVYSYRFHIRPNRTPLINPTLRYTRVDRIFTGAPASEAFRHLLQGVLQTRPLINSFEVLLYSRILRSSLATVVNQFNRPDLNKEVSKLVSEDLAEITEIDNALANLSILWEPALNEALSIGVDQTLLTLINKTYQAPYPQERVGAVTALIFAQAPFRT